MSISRPWRIVAAVVVPLLLLAIVFTAGPGASLFDNSAAASQAATRRACDALIGSVGDTTQQFVAGFDTGSTLATQPLGPVAGKAPKPTMTEAEFTNRVNAARSQIDGLHCDTKDFRSRLVERLNRVHGSGVLAQALVRQLKVSLAGRLPDHPVTRTVRATDDLDQALAEVPQGSTLVLAAGTYRRTAPLVLLRSVTIVGAGMTLTTIESHAPGVAVLVIGGVSATFRALGITPGVASSGVLAGAGSALTFDRTLIAGATAGANGGGGSAIVVAGAVTGATRPHTSVQVVDSVLANNVAGGLAVADVSDVVVRRSTFRLNAECGICFVGGSAGVVESSHFDRNAIGVAVTTTSAPVLRGNDFRRGRFGVQVADASRPTVIRNTFTAATGAALLYLGGSRGTAANNRCTRDRFDIVMRRSAHPTVSGSDCSVVSFG